MKAMRLLNTRIPEEMYQRLRRAAFDRNETQQAIVIKALDYELADPREDLKIDRGPG